MLVSEVASVTIGLSTTPASVASFSVPLLLVDHADVPVDRRYRQVTRSSYATDLTASTDQVGWCAALWGQNYNPAQAYIGRWVGTAISSYNVFPNALSVAATWAALAATGKFELDDGVNQEDISPDFTGDTTMANVCASINTALGASTNFTAYTCALDNLDRITITGITPGASSPTFATGTPGSGVDLTLPAYLGTEIAIDGIDAETLGSAMSAILALDNTPYIMCQRGGSIAQVVAFSTAVNALDKYLLLVCNDEDAKDSVATSDFPYQIEALSHNKTHMCYTEHHTDNGAAADQHPDAAVIGEVLVRLDGEGANNLALASLSSVSQSGLDGDKTTVIPLTVAERTALDAKGCDYLVKPSSVTHLTTGLAAGGNEVRVMIGKAYMAAKISEGIYGYLIANNVVTFSDTDVQAIKGIVDYWATEMANRKLLDADSFVWNFPDAADFTAAQKATHTMTLSNVFSADVQAAVNDVVMTLDFSV
jgi:hypothetical protein